MFATPVLSNGGTKEVYLLVVLNYIDDSREGITEHYVENLF